MIHYYDSLVTSDTSDTSDIDINGMAVQHPAPQRHHWSPTRPRPGPDDENQSLMFFSQPIVPNDLWKRMLMDNHIKIIIY